MAVCECGGRSVRIRRKFWQRILYKAIYRCEQCGKVTQQAAAPVFSRHSNCPRCGTTILKVRRKRDHVDSMSTTLVSRLQGLLGADLHHCEFCRLQFYDFRAVVDRKTEPVKRRLDLSQDSRA